jgi:hypothetical protein
MKYGKSPGKTEIYVSWKNSISVIFQVIEEYIFVLSAFSMSGGIAINYPLIQPFIHYTFLPQICCWVSEEAIKLRSNFRNSTQEVLWPFDNVSLNEGILFGKQ